MMVTGLEKYPFGIRISESGELDAVFSESKTGLGDDSADVEEGAGVASGELATRVERYITPSPDRTTSTLPEPETLLGAISRIVAVRMSPKRRVLFMLATVLYPSV